MSSSDGTFPWLELVRVLVALAPVQILLVVLMALDTFKLVRRRRVLAALAAGVAAAAASFFVNNAVLPATGLTLVTFALVVAPVLEETIKGLYCDWLVRSRRTGFLVDATLLGFAVGAGFGTAENVYYLRHYEDPSLLTWAVRGLGTAVMHGGATALFAALRHLAEALGRRGWRTWLWAWPAAVSFHALFNRSMTHPVAATAVLLVLLPLLLLAIHRSGERNLRAWLGRGFDRDRKLLELVHEGRVLATPLGRRLLSLGETVPPEARADLLCLLRLEAELSLAAKGMLLLRENGFDAPPPADVKEKLAELAWLEESVGRAGRLALREVRPRGARDRWERRLLAQEAAD